MTKKLICLLITIAMVLTLLPGVAFAANTAGLDNFKKVQTYTDGQFTDVTAKDWFEENVAAAYELNLMVGRSGKFFDTESNLTVAEAMTIAARLREIYYTGKAEFVQGNPWYQVYTDYCKKNSIANPDDYDLNKVITRGQFAEIFSKAFPKEALKKINNVQDNMIPDVSKTDKFSAAIYLLYRAGILTGNDSKGTFASETNIKRIEAAAITTRMAQPTLRKSITLVKQSSGGGGSYTPPVVTPTDVAIENVTVSDTGEIKTGEGTISVTSGDEKTEQTLTEQQAKQLATKINTMLDSAPVAKFSGTNLEDSTKINTQEGLNSIISELQAKVTDDNTAKNNIASKTASDIDLQIKVVLSNVNVKSSDYLTVTSMEFDVTPIATTTVKDSTGKTVSVSAEIKSELSDMVKFRLPIDSSLNVTGNEIAVYHETEFIGNYEIKGVAPNTYIEIESKNFSKYGYQLVNENNARAKIGKTLYFKFADAVADVKNGETITLLKPATGDNSKVTISRTVSFTVDKNQQVYGDNLTAGEGFVLSSTDATQATITYKCFPVNKQFTITYKDQGDEAFSGTHGDNYPTKHTYGTATALVAPAKADYTFEGWFTTSDCTGTAVTELGATAYDADITLYAKWKAHEYSTYKFEVTAPENLDTNRENSEASVKLCADSVKDKGYSKVLIKVEMTAKPEGSNPQIIANDGHNDYNLAVVGQWGPSEGFEVAKNYTATTPLKLKFDKAGTYKATFKLVDLNNSESVICEKSATVIVTDKTYTITYKDQSDVSFTGTHGESYPKTHTYGTATTLVNPTKTGYTFGGWYTTSECTGTAVTSLGAEDYAEDITLYATWTENSATLTYDANGHGTAPTAVTMKYTEATNAASAISATGYTFTGWNTKADGTGTSYAAGAEVKAANTDPTATTLYAQWTINTYTVTFDLNGIDGDSPETQTIEYGKKVNKPTDPTDAIHTLEGWYKTKDDTTGALSDSWDFDNDTVTANMTLYAQWQTTISTILERTDSIPTYENFIPSASDSWSKVPTGAWLTDGGNKAFKGQPNSSIFNLACYITDTAYYLSLDDTEHFLLCGDTYVWADDDFGTMTCYMTKGVFTSLTFAGSDQEIESGSGIKFSSLNGTYTAPETKKLSEILPSGFPTSADSAWVNENGKKAYKDGDNIKVGNLTLGKDTTVTKSGDNYVCKSGDATVTFNVKDGAVKSITVTGSSDSNGTYAAPTFKAVYNTKDSANTLTFYYDSSDHRGADVTVYDGTTNYLFDNSKSSGAKWGYNGKRNSIKSVVIDASVAGYKGLTSTAYMFQGMTTATSISGAEHLDVSNVTDMSLMFMNFGGGGTDSHTTLNSVPNVSNWNTANVTNMTGMFWDYGNFSDNLTKVPDVSNWNTANVTNMSGMFQQYGYSSINFNDVPKVSGWSTVSVEDMSTMFRYYGKNSTALTAVPEVCNWNTAEVKTMAEMFREYGASSTVLKAVPDVSGWNTSNVTTMVNLFQYYGNGSVDFVLDLSGWNLSKIASNKGDDVFRFTPKTFEVTIPAKTRDKGNDSNNWYYGDGTNSIAPPTGKTFTLPTN